MIPVPFVFVEDEDIGGEDAGGVAPLGVDVDVTVLIAFRTLVVDTCFGV